MPTEEEIEEAGGLMFIPREPTPNALLEWLDSVWKRRAGSGSQQNVNAAQNQATPPSKSEWFQKGHDILKRLNTS